MAQITATTESLTWLSNSAGIPLEPLQFVPLVKKVAAWDRKFTWIPRSGNGARQAQLFGADDERVGNSGQEDRQHQTDDYFGVEVRLETLDYELPQTTLADESRHVDKADDRNGCDPHSGQYRGQRKRELDLAKRLEGRVPHALGGVEDIGRDRIEPGNNVADQDQQCVADQRHLGGGDRKEASDRCHQEQESDGRDHVQGPGNTNQGPPERAHPPGQDA